MSVYREGLMVRVDVRDNGVGMTPEEKSMLFTKFFRSDNWVIQETVGTGLGLVITRSLVEMQGGEIFVESSPGVGSVFSFTLPISSQALDLEQSEACSGRPMPSLAGKRILVVDDEPDIAELLRLCLERSGYGVLTALNAQEAVEMAVSEQPDLITLDVLLPDQDGFAVLEQLKGDAVTGDIPVVLISILPDDGRGALLGAVDYLTKPISEGPLLAKLERVLDAAEGRLVLVAEDDADTRRLLASHLAPAGYRVIEAVDGAETLSKARAEVPNLVLLDIKMPVMDGVTTLRALRENASTRGLPVVMMTASPSLLEASRTTAHELGVAALLKKPFTPEELATAVDLALGRVPPLRPE